MLRSPHASHILTSSWYWNRSWLEYKDTWILCPSLRENSQVQFFTPIEWKWSQLRWYAIPANKKHRPNVGATLGQRRRRWTSIGSTLGRCLAFAGWVGARCRSRPGPNQTRNKGRDPPPPPPRKKIILLVYRRLGAKGSYLPL